MEQVAALPNQGWSQEIVSERRMTVEHNANIPNCSTPKLRISNTLSTKCANTSQNFGRCDGQELDHGPIQDGRYTHTSVFVEFMHFISPAHRGGTVFW